jgi:hypothetical protein
LLIGWYGEYWDDEAGNQHAKWACDKGKGEGNRMIQMIYENGKRQNSGTEELDSPLCIFPS